MKCWHKWTDWGSPVSTEVMWRRFDKQIIAEEMVQFRTCYKCKMKESRVIYPGRIKH